MVPLRRDAAPTVLAENAARWADEYHAQCATPGGAPRPNPRRYGHPAVRLALRRMSHNKCFYCETRLAEGEEEVDHYVEVSARRDLAFAWDNLYLCCPDCNSQKAPDAQVACADCVDPCSPTQPPSDHLGFADECIFPRNDRGRHTVRKYRLDRDALDLKRSRHLREFLTRHRDLLAHALREGRSALTEREKDLLRRYRDPAMPFSLMMDNCLTDLGL
jgi:uncharacterized Zn-finger protein